jgi:DNA-binding CsgD family transcriptional regulator
MLHRDCTEAMEARSVDEFRRVMVRFANSLEFDTVSVTAIYDQADGTRVLPAVAKNAPGYDDIFDDASRSARDPVSQHCRHNGMPIVWGQQTYLAGGAIDLWEQQSAFGYRFGIALAVHLPGGQHVLVGLDRARTIRENTTECSRMLANVSLFTTYAHGAALHLMPPPAPTLGAAALLTQRELEVLRWTREGYTAWQVGNRLLITERTVNMHARNAARKLGCGSKHHAVIKALHLGLIT